MYETLPPSLCFKKVKMILVFGGTTEGRAAVETLDEAGQTYYYSTRGNGQQVECIHGIRLAGAMEVKEMIDFCREHGIQLLVDAAHPTAQEYRTSC